MISLTNPTRFHLDKTFNPLNSKPVRVFGEIVLFPADLSFSGDVNSSSVYSRSRVLGLFHPVPETNGFGMTFVQQTDQTSVLYLLQRAFDHPSLGDAGVLNVGGSYVGARVDFGTLLPVSSPQEVRDLLASPSLANSTVGPVRLTLRSNN